MTRMILRPQPAADELATRLRRDGHAPVLYPLLTYQPGGESSLVTPCLNEADIVIAVSAAAVQHASRYLQQQHRRPTVPAIWRWGPPRRPTGNSSIFR